MLLAAGLIAAVKPRRPYWIYPALALVAVLVALEANALRVAGIALTLEHLGGISPAPLTGL
ncbi:MAG: hypothetical protein DME07_25290 [Candidatus Rokuibacteriota bacterium]|nr:MAG: hypothetical protein DME07_25290 [Candidatus Rokubacteria bacterium]